MIECEIYKQLKVFKLSTSSVNQKYIVSYNKRSFEVSESVVQLIYILQRSNSISEVIEIFYVENGRMYSEAEINELIDVYICPIIEAYKTKRVKPLIISVELISEVSIQYFSNLLKILFEKRIMIMIIILFAICDIVFYLITMMNIPQMNLYTVSGLILLIILSSFMHELGHVSACRYFNVNHGGIGFGLYLMFPVFYADVSEIWTLSRGKRLIVNIAGVYFQFILLIPCLILYFYTHCDVLKYFIFAININLLMTLNPFFKFDGYWIVSDMLGVPNLRKRANELISYYIDKLRKNKMKESKPYLLSINRNAKIFLFVYSIIVNLFFIYFFCYILPIFFYNFFKTYPILITNFFLVLSIGKSPDFALVLNVLAQTSFFVFTIYMLVRKFFPFIKKWLVKKMI